MIGQLFLQAFFEGQRQLQVQLQVQESFLTLRHDMTPVHSVWRVISWLSG